MTSHSIDDDASWGRHTGQLRDEHSNARKEAVRELIATAQARFERGNPYSAADVFENIAAILRSKL